MGATTEMRDMLDAYGIEVTMHKPMTKAELARENAKLRKLVRDLYEMAYPEYPSAFEAAFADRMCELGVEVDG